MSKEKQIREIIEVLNSKSIKWGRGDTTDKDIAESLYNAGYRKQSEGEWKVSGVYLKSMNCSVCDYTANSIYEKTNYCPNCGASMKGGAE